jgi:ESS family glutamate:Na+ symporter
VLLETLLVIALCMVGGELLFTLLQRHQITLPAFVCALFVGLILANAADLTGRYTVKANAVDTWGSIGLSLFLAEALMSLKLWELLDLALPMIGILAAQATQMALYARFVTFRAMGGDYDAAVMAAGHCGFGLGATPTAVANMEAATKRYGPSPQAFLVVPMVGAFFIDITNALVIQLFLARPWAR